MGPSSVLRAIEASPLAVPPGDRAAVLENAFRNAILAADKRPLPRTETAALLRMWEEARREVALEAMLAPFRGSVEFLADPTDPTPLEWDALE